MINAFDGFRLTSIDGAMNYFYIQMDADNDVTLNLISATSNIDFPIGCTNVAFFSPTGLCINSNGTFAYDTNNNLNTQNNYINNGVYSSINFCIGSNNVIGSFSMMNNYFTDGYGVLSMMGNDIMDVQNLKVLGYIDL